MIAWIGWYADEMLASEVAEHLLLGRPRPAQAEQRLPASTAPAVADPAVARARAIMLDHIDEPLTCRDIARRVGLSLRQLERRFRVELHCSPFRSRSSGYRPGR